jgi:hypothetical protein
MNTFHGTTTQNIAISSYHFITKTTRTEHLGRHRDKHGWGKEERKA